MLMLAGAIAMLAWGNRRPHIPDGYLPITFSWDDSLDAARLNGPAFRQISSGAAGRIGPSDAPVQIVVFADYSCGACSLFDSVLARLHMRLPEHVTIVMKHFQPQGDRIGILPHRGAVCASAQGIFPAYHELASGNPDFRYRLTDGDFLSDYSGLAGLDTEKFIGCLEDGQSLRPVHGDTEQGLALGVRRTPTSFVNGIRVVGAVPEEMLLRLVAIELDRRVPR
ncbi:MAG: thioredoxin domain-containing protein [Gemmatimonadales bacterium]|nr:thioredoxin domain-containing protein [Gemmatimonadales bacterium]MDZ4389527.1 thioredoxin domain-containing protein [Gemmatimonadales bacterium]